LWESWSNPELPSASGTVSSCALLLILWVALPDKKPDRQRC
jgi:hypothetical protein